MKELPRICISELKACFEDEWGYETQYEPYGSEEKRIEMQRAWYWFCIGWEKAQSFAEHNNGQSTEYP